jgi:hypothetical protein
VRGTPEEGSRTRFPQPFAQQYSEAPPSYRVNLNQSSKVYGDITFDTGNDGHLGVWGARIDIIKHVVPMDGQADDPYVKHFSLLDQETSQKEMGLPDKRPKFRLLDFFLSMKPLIKPLKGDIDLGDKYVHTDEIIAMALIRTCTADLLPLSHRLPSLYKTIYFPHHFDWHFWQERRNPPTELSFDHAPKALYRLIQIASAVRARFMSSGQRLTIHGAGDHWSAFDVASLRDPDLVYRLYEDFLAIKNRKGSHWIAENPWKTIMLAVLLQVQADRYYKGHLAQYFTPCWSWLYEVLNPPWFPNLTGQSFIFWVSVAAGLNYLLKGITRKLKPHELDPATPASMTDVQAPLERNPEKEIATEIQNAINRASWNRVFFITESGRFGLGPVGTRPGDEVFTLLGGHVPFVLRRVGGDFERGGEHEKYQLLGESYVHGVMDGEFWVKEKRLQKDDLEWMKRLSSKIVLL